MNPMPLNFQNYYGTANDRQDKDNKLSQFSGKNESLISSEFEAFTEACKDFSRNHNPNALSYQISNLISTYKKFVGMPIKKGGNNE